MELSGKVAIVTGAAGHIGAECAREIGRQGAKVVVTDLDGKNIEGIAAEICHAGGDAVAHRGSIAVEEDVVALVRTARESYGGVDVLVNVAARVREGHKEKNFDILTVDYWDAVMSVNLRGAMLCCKHTVPLMLERGSGSIINFGSTAALLGDEGLLAYSTTKAGLLGFTRSVATIYGKQGIRCNSVCPGSVWTEAQMAPMGDWKDLAERTRLTPRLGKASDIAHMVAFLASDKSGYVTGQNFVVDGGGTVHQPWVRVK